jgi:putative ABC transport system permease protein
MDRRTLKRRHRLTPFDVLATATLGPRTRLVRATLSALGIAIGIAALVALLGIPASQKAQSEADYEAMGANLITVFPGTNQQDQSKITIPLTAPVMVDAIGPVKATLTLYEIPDVGVFRTDAIPSGQTGGITAAIPQGDLLTTLNIGLAQGRWFDPGLLELPTVVLGDAAARRLDAGVGNRIWIDRQWWAVIGVLEPLELAEQLDSTAFLAQGPAERLHPDLPIGSIYVSTTSGRSKAVRGVMAATVNPANPRGVNVSQLSPFDTAREMAENTLSKLSLGLGGVALLVGGIGIANTMVVAVMERRGEIGLRRAMGARTGQIALQFVLEAAVIGLGGGVMGAAFGVYVVYLYTAAFSQLFAIPVWLLGAGPGMSVVIGAIAGLYPSLKAARQSPTTALRAV